MVIESSLTVDTVSEVDCVTLPHAAEIVVLPVRILLTNPVSSMEATVGLDELQSTDEVISSVELSLKVPMAVNCLTAPAGMDESSGAIASETSVAFVTVTDAVAEMVPEIAVTVVVPGPTATPSPFASIVRTSTTLEDHSAFSTCVLPSSKLPVAVNCCCVPGAIEALAGESVMDKRCAGTTVMVVVSVKLPTVAVMVVVPAARIVASPLPSMVAILIVDELHFTPLTRSWIDPSL